MQHHASHNLNAIERDASIFWREINPRPSSCFQLKKLLGMYATYEEWETVINLASRAVLHLNRNYERAEFYYIWICALNESFDKGSLIHLGNHLLFMGDKYAPFYSLAAIAFHFAGKSKLALDLVKSQKKNNHTKSRYYRECIALIYCSLSKVEDNKSKIKIGMGIYKKLCLDKYSSYSTWRNYLKILSNFDCEVTMSFMYNEMVNRFPFCHEPYIVAALIAIQEENWEESAFILKKILKDNPKNGDALLALIQSYEGLNQYEIALELLNSSKHMFHENDYDFNFSMGRIMEKLGKEKNSPEYYEECLSHYEKSLEAALKMNFETSFISSKIDEINKINKVLKAKSVLLESLNSFLETKKPSISRLLPIEKMDRNFKVSNE